jgi:hypothetical protein
MTSESMCVTVGGHTESHHCMTRGCFTVTVDRITRVAQFTAT